MNTHRTKILSTLSVTALCLALSSPSAGQRRRDLPDREAGSARGDPPAAELPSSTSSLSTSVAALHSENLQRAADDYKERSLEAFKGREIVAGDETLGQVRDVIVDSKTGRITHVIASSGGLLGAGDTLRIVPSDHIAINEEKVSTKLSRKAFEALPRLAEEDLDAGRVPGTDGGVVLGSLRGQKIRAGGAEVGEVEDVALDFRNGLAVAVIEVNGEFAGTDGKFLVPFDRLGNRGRKAKTLEARIDRADFAHVQPETSAVVGGPAQPNPEDQPLSPTGRADPGSDAPRHADRDARDTNGRSNLSTAVPRDGRRDPFFPDTGGRARGSVVPGNDAEPAKENDSPRR